MKKLLLPCSVLLLLLLTACSPFDLLSPPGGGQLSLSVETAQRGAPITASAARGGRATPSFSCEEEQGGALRFTLCASGSVTCTLTWLGGSLTMRAVNRAGRLTLSHTLTTTGQGIRQQTAETDSGGGLCLFQLQIPRACLSGATLTLSFGGRLYAYTYPNENGGYFA